MGRQQADGLTGDVEGTRGLSPIFYSIDAPALRDPDDAAVIACALAANAEIIVSGDADLLNLKHYQNVRIVSAPKRLNCFEE